MTILKIYKTFPSIELPKFSTEQSACFDLSFQNAGKFEYTGYNKQNKMFSRPFKDGNLYVNAGDRILVPTGLIFDIPKGFSVRVHARSGISLKQGLVLANAEGVIDSDYMEETFVMLTNVSNKNVEISNLSRICQGELVKNNRVAFEEIKERPTRDNTNRKGGFGSTGTKALDNPSANTI
jgi:dUTP pyrophosphatase